MISFSSSSQLAAYIFLSILGLVIACGLLNIIYFFVMCLFERNRNEENRENIALVI